jgi:hypothetical protein
MPQSAPITDLMQGGALKLMPPRGSIMEKRKPKSTIADDELAAQRLNLS